MTTDETTRHRRLVASWLNRLAKLCVRPGEWSEADFEEYLGDMTVALCARFPARVFDALTLAEVAEGQRWLPPLAHVMERLEQVEARRGGGSAPGASAVPLPDGAERLGPADQSWLAFWVKRCAEIDAADRDGAAPFAAVYAGLRDAAAARARLASLMRAHAPAAWRLLSGAADRGSLDGPTEAERAAVREAAEGARQALQMPKPAAWRVPVRPDAPAPARPLGALPPEILAAARASNPLIAEARAMLEADAGAASVKSSPQGAPEVAEQPEPAGAFDW